MTRALLSSLLLLLACDGTGDDSGFVVADFTAGTFQISTTAVQDMCMDGAFSAVFMPDGTTRDWPATTEIPAFTALPTTYSVTLPAPYSDMEITVEAEGEGGFRFADAVQTAVLIDDATWPGCVVDMGISASFTILGADSFAGSAVMSMSNFVGDNCPVVQGDPCSVTLDLNGARQ